MQKLQSWSTALMSLILDLTNLWYSKLYDLPILACIVLEINGIFKYVSFNIIFPREEPGAEREFNAGHRKGWDPGPGLTLYVTSDGEPWHRVLAMLLMVVMNHIFKSSFF